MTSDKFVAWLEGFLAAADKPLSAIQVKLVQEQLAKVAPEPLLYWHTSKWPCNTVTSTSGTMLPTTPLDITRY